MSAMFRHISELVSRVPLDPTSTLCAIALLSVGALIWHVRRAPAQVAAPKRRPAAQARRIAAGRRGRRVTR